MTAQRRAVRIVRLIESCHALRAHVPSALLAASNNTQAMTSVQESFFPGRTSPLLGVSAIRAAGVYVLIFCAMLAMCTLVRSTLLESFYVPSSSMAPTLERDDYVVVAKLAYGLELPLLNRRVVTWESPSRGEVIVFNRSDDPTTTADESARSMVKRVIGVAGDTVSINGPHVMVNGNLLAEPYVRGSRRDSQPVQQIPGVQKFTVPNGAVFVLGDNRDESYDSRWWGDPFVRVSQVVGPVAAVY